MARPLIQVRAVIPEALGPALCPVLAMIVVVSGELRRYDRQVAGLATTRYWEASALRDVGSLVPRGRLATPRRRP